LRYFQPILLNKWLENFAYKLTFQSIHLLLAIVLLSLTLLIVLLRAFQATRVVLLLKIRVIMLKKLINIFLPHQKQ
jgi:hypothetical protein